MLSFRPRAGDELPPGSEWTVSFLETGAAIGNSKIRPDLLCAFVDAYRRRDTLLPPCVHPLKPAHPYT
jgi:hypothetical protein